MAHKSELPWVNKVHNTKTFGQGDIRPGAFFHDADNLWGCWDRGNQSRSVSIISRGLWERMYWCHWFNASPRQIHG